MVYATLNYGSIEDCLLLGLLHWCQLRLSKPGHYHSVQVFFWDQTSSNHSIMIHLIHPCWDWHISCCLSEKKRGFIEALLLWMDGCDDPLQVGCPGKGSKGIMMLSYGRMTAESLRVGLRHILTFLYFAGSLADFRSICIYIYMYCRPYCLYLCFNIVYIHIYIFIFIHTI